MRVLAAGVLSGFSVAAMGQILLEAEPYFLESLLENWTHV